MTRSVSYNPSDMECQKQKIKILCNLTFVIHIQRKLYVKDKFCTLLNFNYTLLNVNYMLSNKYCTLLNVNCMLSNNCCTLLKADYMFDVNCIKVKRVLYAIEQLSYLSCPAKLLPESGTYFRDRGKIFRKCQPVSAECRFGFTPPFT